MIRTNPATIALNSSKSGIWIFSDDVMIGNTHKKRIERFMQDGFNSDLLKRINGPIGLPINAQTPQEIAISIMAEIISSLRYQKESIEELRENWKNR